MANLEQYAPGPARVAQVRKEGEKWTLVLVREMRHSPEKVWQALTDPAHLREWAPFDADRSLGTGGRTGKDRTPGGSWSRGEAAALGSRSGTTSTADSLRWAPRAGTSASMCWIGF